MLLPALASAKLCGDDVEGKDVPCACADVVVSDVKLGDDPVVASPCDGDGLIVRAASPEHAVTIDLRGKVLRGKGRGAGVRLLYGGPGGARVVSSGGPATLEGFRDGVVAHGRDSVALIEDLRVSKSKRDGLRVFAPGYEVRATEVTGSKRDGFWLRGSDFRVVTTRAIRNGRYGYFVQGQSATLGEAGSGMRSYGSGRAGMHLLGMGLRLEDCVVAESKKAGVEVNAMNVTMVQCTAVGNGGDGMAVSGGDIWMRGNRAERNGGNGFVAHGVKMQDAGGNVGRDNRGEGQKRPATQCQIGGEPCAS